MVVRRDRVFVGERNVLLISQRCQRGPTKISKAQSKRLPSTRELGIRNMKFFSGCFRFQPAIYNSHWSAKKWELKVWNIMNIYFKLYVAELMNFLRWKIGEDSETAFN